MGSREPSGSGPIAIVGSAASLFPHTLASYWRDRGEDVCIVSDKDAAAEFAEFGVPVVIARDQSKGARRWLTGFIGRRIATLGGAAQRLQTSRIHNAVGQHGFTPTALEYIYETALKITSEMVQIRPRVVYGMEASSYGLATAWCAAPRLLMPWGADVYMYGESTTLHSLLTRYVLRHVDMVVMGSIAAGAYIQERYGVEKERLRIATWGVDLNEFQAPSVGRRCALRQQYGMPVSAQVVLNVRRFVPLWGSETALEAFLQVAGHNADVHFVLLGGAGTEARTTAAEQRVAAAGYSGRFHFIHGNAALETCRNLMCIADVFTSLMSKGDLRSGSITQAVACGAAPILSDQPEYAAMEPLGFRRLVAAADEADTVRNQILRLLADDSLRAEIVEANLRYVRQHEDLQQNQTELLNLVNSVANRAGHVRQT